MAKIEMTVAASYVQWGLWEGCREFMQNGLDAQKDGATFEVTYKAADETLRIRTVGASLTTRSLLLGATTKRGRADQVGQFGEGYKLALLGLVNHGHPVRILTGNETWVPTIERSARFGGEPVLVINRTKRATSRDEVDVWISGVTAAAWAEIRPRFLTLVPASESIETEYGTILLDEPHAGHVFVGGIFIEQVKDLRYGYDLRPHSARVDRDRRVVDRWDIEYQAAHSWCEAVTRDEARLEPFAVLLMQGALDVQAARYGGASDAVRKALHARFVKQFGDGAIPVESEEAAEQARSLGRRGIVVPETMRELLSKDGETLATVREKIRKEAARTFGIEDLTHEEAWNWMRAVEMVSAVRPHLRLAQFRVVEFPDPKLLGLWKVKEDGVPEVLVARRVLASFKEALCTVVHEVAHDTGGAGDASCEFEQALQCLWADIVENIDGRRP